MSCRMLCPQLHISLQHASQPVLRRMGRGHYTAAMLQRAVERLRAHWPVMGLGRTSSRASPANVRKMWPACWISCARRPFSYAHVFPIPAAPAPPPTVSTGTCPSRSSRSGPPVSAPPWRSAVRLSGRPSWPCRACCWPPTAPPPARPPARRRKAVKGVNEFYVPCILPAGAHPGRDLLAVRPLSVTDKGLLVEPLADWASLPGLQGGPSPQCRCRCRRERTDADRPAPAWRVECSLAPRALNRPAPDAKRGSRAARQGSLFSCQGILPARC